MHDIVGKKDEDRERENTIHYWCEIYGVICKIKHTAEKLDKLIQVATTDCQFYKFIVFDKSTHKFNNHCDNLNQLRGYARLSVQCLPGLLRSIKLAIQVA